jgi:hypothetical protein
MDPAEFAARWKGSTLTERAASQSHFGDLCRMLGWRTPSDLDPTGEWFAFEKGAEKLGGGDGFADNLYPGDCGTPDFIELDSMIDVRPKQNNRTRSVDDPEARAAVARVVDRLVRE